jgi:UDP-4-amino-4,6-dideoxy-N-acetyl-beta-L-altrosamine transaminase
MNYIPYGKHSISEQDIQAVIEVLKSDLITQGPRVEKFERAVADYCGAKYAVAVSNGTAALHLACLAAGLTEGNTLWTSPNTFVASANCALYCGASPDFVDISPITYNMDENLLEKKLLKAEKNDKIPQIVIPVHFSGKSCDMEKIYYLSKKYNFVVIEDASHAIGGSYKNSKIGSCRFSDMAVFSFHPVKIITSGEGGMILTNRKDYYDKLVLYRTHGIVKDPQFMESPTEGVWYYQQVALGMNYRITDIQAALGLSQLKRIDDFVSRRQEIAARYDNLLEGLPLKIPVRQSYSHSAFHLYVVQLDLENIKLSRRMLFERIRDDGISLNVHYIPVHLQPYYRRLGFKESDFPHAEQYYKQAATLPIYFDMTDNDQVRVVDSLKRALL